MSRGALNNAQFDLLLTNEREVEHKRRQDRAGIQSPELEAEVEAQPSTANYLVYPPGASQDFSSPPHGPQLVASSKKEFVAKRQAQKIGGTVERWQHGKPPTSV